MVRLKLSALLFALAGIVYSCKQVPKENNQVLKSNTLYFEEITEFEYKGHDYIRFSKYPSEAQSSTGVVHNPECKKCFQQFD